MDPQPTSTHSSETAAAAADRRHHERTASNAEVRIEIDPQSLSGRCENVSRAGVLFFAEGSVRVTVILDEQGQKQRLSGRIVRVERMSPESSGFAVEFDDN